MCGTGPNMNERNKQGDLLTLDYNMTPIRRKPSGGAVLVGSISDSRVGGSGSIPGSVTFYY